MNRFYQAWLETAKTRAEAANVRWNPACCEKSGKIEKSQRWPLRRLIALPPPDIWLARFHHIEGDIIALADLPISEATGFEASSVMSPHWREFLQAAIINELLMKRNKVAQANAVARAIRIISLCSETPKPWSLSAEDIRRAYNTALRAGSSGKLAMNVVMVVKDLFDRQHLGDHAPLAHAAIPYADQHSRAAQKVVNHQKRRESSNHNIHNVRSNLRDRKSAERLPEQRAFWELMRIIFTETPRTFTDRIRFNALKIHVLAGFRVGESIMIPLDCLRWRQYFDPNGTPAGDKGGISRSLSLRYFALKQVEDEDDGQAEVKLVERFQEVPLLFEEMLVEIVNETVSVTDPLRERLKRQTASGRLIPEYPQDALVGAVEMYVRVAGSIRTTDEPIKEKAMADYRISHSLTALRDIRADQERAANRGRVRPVYAYWHTQEAGPPARYKSGKIVTQRIDYRDAYFRVSDVEDFIHRKLPTKLPDLDPFIGPHGGPFFPHELLFLHPSRALIEGRDGGLIDVENYFSGGRLASQDLQLQLAKSKNSLFARYGETPGERTLSLISHSTRHLQNSELFRLGVADTVITKRFGRTTTAQSHTYDHRALAEALGAIDLPSSAQALVPERAHDTLKLIVAGKVKGPLVDEFLEIQRTQGDDAAFEYMAAEADGLHVTPYGFCLSSFTVDPCPKHLQCFNGCRHLARTDNPAETASLEKVRKRTETALAAAEASPAKTVGRKNQIAHAKTLLENIDASIAARPGEQVFPNGPDFSDPIGKPTSIIDTALSARRAV